MFLVPLDTPIILIGCNPILARLYCSQYKVKAEFGTLSDEALYKYQELKRKYTSTMIVLGSDVYEKLNPLGAFLTDWVFERYLGDIKQVDFIDIYKYSKDNFSKILYKILKSIKLAIVHGNCQTDLIRKILQSNKDFAKQYLVVKTLPVHVSGCAENYRLLDELGVLKEISLFITQPIKDNNKFGASLSNAILSQKMHDNCNCITIPNLYFSGYFPQFYHTRNDGSILSQNLFNNSDSLIDTMIVHGFSIDRIIDLVQDKELIPINFLIKHAEMSIQNLKDREVNDNCTVIISDVIESQWRSAVLFRSVNHPTISLLAVLCKRILKHLSLEGDVFFDETDNLRGSDAIIYPCIEQLLDSNNGISNYLYFPSRQLYNYQWDFMAFIRNYCNFFSQQILENSKIISAHLYKNANNELYIRVFWTKISKAVSYRIQKRHKLRTYGKPLFFLKIVLMMTKI